MVARGSVFAGKMVWRSRRRSAGGAKRVGKRCVVMRVWMYLLKRGLRGIG